jgi:hypothetical protein
MFSKILRFLNRDLTGRTWEAQSVHPYFGDMVFFGNQDATRAYWEVSEFKLPVTDRLISIYLKGTDAGPTPHEERFCRELVDRHTAFVAECRPVVEAELSKRPTKWSATGERLQLESFEIPEHGDPMKPWEATFSVQEVDGLFTVEFVESRAIGARFDD